METVNWLRLAMRLATTSTIVALLAACGGPGSETDPDMALATAELDPPTCSDGVKSGTESDVDCGGGCSRKCDTNQTCATPVDCESKLCVGSHCQAFSCTDGVLNGAETAVDCGGGDCRPCDPGSRCVSTSDCGSRLCTNGVCVLPGHCSNGSWDATEADVDCGGDCAPCVGGKSCRFRGDCASGRCVSGTPTDTCASDTCHDGARNGRETDVDCGGVCIPCVLGQGCGRSSDCASGVCVNDHCAGPTCSDGVKNGDETAVDCGGTCTAKCSGGGGCLADADCSSGKCWSGKCFSCSDGVKNGNEGDVDCGGKCATKCASARACAMSADCASGVCRDRACAASSCSDGILNGAETAVDCGGGTCSKCKAGGACKSNTDCVSARCSSGACAYATHCSNGVRDSTETDVDCGGECKTCNSGQICKVAADCTYGVCPSSKRCGASTCTNGVRDGLETAVDCGGTCAPCANGKTCTSALDCVSKVCSGGTCAAARCADGIANGTETASDCGGTCATHCADGSTCTVGADCAGGVCTAGKCTSCSDGIKNGSEADVDCGGTCATKCADRRACLVNADCASGACSGGSCISCSDGRQNGTETNQDCGGSCPTKCVNGAACLTGADCQSHRCVNQVCAWPTCSNGLLDGTETDIDCGPDCAQCKGGARCIENTDCESHVCNAGRCTAPSYEAVAALDPVTAHEYRRYDVALPWHDAVDQCASLGGHLVSIESPWENALIANLIAKGSKNLYWLGGADEHRIGYFWPWVNGEGNEYINWAPGQPDWSESGPMYLTMMRSWHNNMPAGSWNDGNGTSSDPYFQLANYGYVCEWEGAVHNGNAYRLVDLGVSWNEANDRCAAMGAHLATVTTAVENGAVYQLTQRGRKNSYWLGGTDEGSEGSWRWVNGEAWSYTGWAPEEPDNAATAGENYLSIVRIAHDRDPGEWNDASGVNADPFYQESNFGFVCEWEGTALGRSTYRLFESARTHASAKDDCTMLGGHLATISSTEENAAVFQMVTRGTKNSYWLDGATDFRTGTWELSDHTPLAYANWGATEPASHGYFLSMLRATHGTEAGKWRGATATSTDPFFAANTYGYVCEWDQTACANDSQCQSAFCAYNRCQPASDDPTATTVTLDGKEYTAYQAPGDPFRVFCQKPCSFDQEYYRAQYRGFRKAHQVMRETTGIELSPDRLPFDIHPQVDDWCRTLDGFTGYSGLNLHKVSGMTGSYGCTPWQGEVTVANIERFDQQTLTLHEYTHVFHYEHSLFPGEVFPQIFAAYLTSPGGRDLCGPAWVVLPEGPFMYRACHQNGLVGDDLGPIMRNLNGLIEAGAGISWSPGGFIAVHQNIELFDQRTASNTQNAFWAYVEAGNSPLFLGDEGVYPPSGGTVSLLKGYVTLAVPAGAVSTQTPFRLTYLSSYGGVTQTLLTDDDRGMDQRFVLMPKTETLVRGSYMTFASPVLLSVKHKASSIVAGQNEANLRILHQTANGMPAVVVAGSQSDVAHHIVSAPITEDGVYFVGWP